MLHFLFLLRGSFLKPEIWAEFFKDAPPDSYMVWAHCTDREACLADPGAKLLKARVVRTVWSMRSVDLMTPFVHLLRLAMGETHYAWKNGGMREKFVLISDATLPVKPFGHAHAELLSHKESDWCFYPPRSWCKGTIDGVSMLLVKHHQWVALNRRDAYWIMRDWDHGNWTDYGHSWRIPLRVGGWAGKNRSAIRRQFQQVRFGKRPPSNEEAPYALSHGPLFVREDDVEGKHRLFRKRHCFTYVDWPMTVGLPQVLEQKATYAVEKEADDAGQFWLRSGDGQLIATNGSDTSNEIGSMTHSLLSGTGNLLSAGAGRSHPWTLDFLTDETLEAFKRSAFLFARKFSANSSLPSFAERMFH